MILTTVEQIPLRVDSDGVIRVGKTRVTIDTVVQAFEEGATAEEIAQQYSSLTLAEVYSTIAYYRRREPEVKEYLRQRRHLAQAIRKENESRFSPQGVRERLLARRVDKR
ncbi:MAG: DUF433 domain-containing protein [Chloroflexi bacterium]|nr:DUF433 domain-containing protein [Chloroflexota bacterium]